MPMFSLESGSFQDYLTSSNSNQMQNPLDMHLGKCLHLQDAFHEEIRNLEALGIFEETKDVTEWVNSFVIMEKKLPLNSRKSHSPGHSMNKKLQICLDARELNEALEREPYYTCSIQEIMGKFHGMTKFTIADFNKGYWMVELDPESRKYTMMYLEDFNGRDFQWVPLLHKMCSKGNWMQFSLVFLELQA